MNKFRLLLAITTIFTLFLGISSLSAQVSGRVFRDFNGNGTQQTSTTYNELGLPNVTISAFGTNGTSLGSVTTNAQGDYTLPSVSGAIRLEFTLPTGAYPTNASAGGGALVRFLTAPATLVNLAANFPEDYAVNQNPDMATPMYVNGNPLGGGTSGTRNAILGIEYDDVNQGFPIDNWGTNAQVGAIYGMAYQRETKKMFMSAFLKRHVGFGPLGIGGIYVRDQNTGTVSNFVRLSDIGVNVGTNPHSGLPANANQANSDLATFAAVGKRGIGDLEISEDGKSLWFVNLFDKRLYKININNPATTPTAADVQFFVIPNPSCANAEFRPFAVKYYRGKVYVGGVCSNETNGTETGLTGTVYEMNPSTGAFTVVATVPYTGFIHDVDQGQDDDKWHHWINTYQTTPQSAGGEYPNYAQPMMTGIEFDDNGNMLVSTRDRFGDQMGRLNYPAISGNTSLVNGITAGDIQILKKCTSGATRFTLENNARVCGGTATGGANNGHGPGNGEYFLDAAVCCHGESSLGSIAVLRGSNEVWATTLDPLNIWSAGHYAYNVSNGSVKRKSELYISNDVATFGKANGLGDVELLLDAAPIEIGNYVWNDANANGIQDVGESGINGVSVSLFENGTQVGITSTSNGGQYYFDNLKPFTAYEVRIVTASNTPLNNLTPTSANVPSTDEVDSDAFNNSGTATIAYTTGASGVNNHSLDFGFKQKLPDLKLTKTAQNQRVELGNNAIFTLVLTNEGEGNATGIEVKDSVGAGFQFVSANPSAAFNSATGVWTVGNLASGAVTTLVLTYRTTAQGVLFNRAEVSKMNETDTDSSPNNRNPAEDDLDNACVSVPIYLCRGDVYTATVSNTYTGIQWFKNSNPISGANSNTLSISDRGSYTFTATNLNCAEASCCAFIIDTSAFPNIIVQNPQPIICFGESTNLATFTSDANAQTNGSGSFTFFNTLQNAQNNTSALSSGNVNPTTTTKYYIRKNSTQSSCVDLDSIIVTVNPKPVYNDATTTICSGESVNLTALINNYNTIQTPQWKQGSVNGITVSTPTNVSPSVTTVYFLLGENASGCKDTAQVTVTVNQKPNLGSDQTLVCNGAIAPNSYNFAQNGTYRVVSQPSGASASANASGQAINMNVAGIYTFEITNASGCKDTASVTIPTCNCQNPDISISGIPAAMCQPTTYNLTSLTVTDANNINGTLSYYATANDAVNATNALTNTTVSVSGQYFIRKTSNDGGVGVCYDTASAFITINPKPVYNDATTTICAGSSVNLTTLITNYNTVQNPIWKQGSVNGTTVSTPTNVSPSVTTVYFLLGENASGCKDTAQVTVTVNQKPNLGSDTTLAFSVGNIPNSFNFNQSGTYNILSQPSGASAAVNNSGMASNLNKVGAYTFEFINASGCRDTAIVTVPQTLTLGNSVFNDANNNGVKDGSEVGIANLQIILFDSSNNPLDTVFTDNNGNYSFIGLMNGDYYVKINNVPTGMLSSTGDGINDTDGNGFYEPATVGDSDNTDHGRQISPSMVVSNTVTLTLGNELANDGDNDPNTNLTLDLGLYSPETLTLGNLVFNDQNNNGIRDPQEPPLANIQLILFNDSNVALDTVLTDANGNYAFTGLTNGNYYVKINNVPAGFVSSTGDGVSDTDASGAYEPSNVGDVNNSDRGTQVSATMVVSNTITLTLGGEPTDDGDNNPNTNLTLDFGLYQPQTLILAGTLFVDTNNNGIQDPSETAGLGNQPVILYNLGADGIAGTPDDQIVNTTVTNVGGSYAFVGLPEGNYYVKINNLGGGYVSSTGGGETDNDGQGTYEPANVGDTDKVDHGTHISPTMVVSNVINLTVGQEPTNDNDNDPNTNTTIDFGFFFPETLSLGNIVFNDVNNNGIKDGSENGIQNIQLVLFNNQGIAIDTTTTDVNGNYLFTGLQAGDYIINIINVPVGFVSSTGDGATDKDGNGAFEPAPNNDTDDNDKGTKITNGTITSGVITLTYQGESTTDGDTDPNTNLTVDFGLYQVQGLTIGSLVFNDANNNGIREIDEEGISGLQMILLDRNRNPLDTIFTDDNGNYSFSGLDNGDYYIKINNVPANFVSSTGDGASDRDGAGAFEPSNVGDVNNRDHGTQISPTMVISDLITLALGTEPTTDGDNDANTNLTVDFGLYNIVPLTLGGSLFVDLNNDGIQNPSETAGLNGIPIVLYGLGNDGIAGTADDVIIATTTTDANGNYNFTNLQAGNYYVKVNNLPNSYLSSTGDGITDTDTSGVYEPANIGDVNGADHGTQVLGMQMITSSVINLSVGQEPTNDGDNDANTNLTVDLGVYQPQVFDLSLRKQLANGQAGIVDSGAVVTFTIFVKNEGTATAYDVEVVDYLPEGLQLADNSWEILSSNIVKRNLSAPLLAGDSVGLNISVRIVKYIAQIRNTAEIVKAALTQGGVNAVDKDSNADTNPNNDNPNEDDFGSAIINVAKPQSQPDTIDIDFTINGIDGTITQTVCSGDTVRFSAILDGGVTRYDWDFKDNTPHQSGKNTTHVFNVTTQTSFPVTLTVLDSLGKIGSETHYITIAAPTKANAGIDRTVCEGDSVQLGASGGIKYTWTPASGLNSTTIFNPIARPTATTDYIVLVENENGCKAKDTVRVTVVPTPRIVSDIRSLSTCAGKDVPVSIKLNQPILSFIISGSAGYKNASVTDSTLTFDAVLNGRQNDVIVTLRGEGNCAVSTKFDLYQAAAPTAYFTIIEPACMDNDLKLLFTGSTSPAAVLTYNLGAGGTLVYQSPATATRPKGDTTIVRYNDFGSKIIQLNVKEGTCEANKTESTFAKKSPTATILTSDTTVCKDQCLTLRGTTNFTNTMLMWSDDKGNTDGITPPMGSDTTRVCPKNPITRYVLTAMDQNGCMGFDTITVRVDSSVPVLRNVPQNITVNCPDVPTPPTNVTATDNCNPTPPRVTMTERVVAGNCAGNYTIVRTWTATNSSGTSSTASQTITVVDTIAPIFDKVPPRTITIDCTDALPLETLTATDACDGKIQVTETRDTSVVDSCQFIIKRHWCAMDKCGNMSTAGQIVVVKDQKAPIFSNVPQDVTLNCNGTIPAVQNPTVTDNCDSNPQVRFTENRDSSGCTVRVTRTWIATDKCGNGGSARQVITISDTVKPIIQVINARFRNLKNGDTLTMKCDSITNFVQADATATDNCDNSPRLTFEDRGSRSGVCSREGYIALRSFVWLATDKCGNWDSLKFYIKVVDNQKPTLQGVPRDTTVLNENQIPSRPNNITATDNCDSNPTVSYTETRTGGGECGANATPLTIIRTWTAKDQCDNTTTGVQRITVTNSTAGRDTTKPVIRPTNPRLAPLSQGDTLLMTCETFAEFSPRDFSITDNCDPNPTATMQEIGRDTGTCPTKGYKVLMECQVTATDKSGNVATFSFFVKFTDDKAPVLIGVPRDTTVSNANSVPAPASVTANDNCDGNNIRVDYRETRTNTPNPNDPCNGGSTLITRTWTSTDQCGNVTERSQRITVTGSGAGDTEKPKIIFLNPILQKLSKNDTFTMACDTAVAFEVEDARVTDNCDPNPRLTFEDFGAKEGVCSRDGFKVLMYCAYVAADAAGNRDTFTFYVKIVDRNAPILQNVPANITVTNANQIPPRPSNITAEDDCDETVVVQFNESRSGGTGADSCSSIITRTWTATDQCGNATQKSQRITVQGQDVTPPQIIFLNPILQKLRKNDTFSMACDTAVAFEVTDARIKDNCDPNPRLTFEDFGAKEGVCSRDGFKVLMYCAYVAVDNRGNRDTFTFYVRIVDRNAPVLKNIPQNVTVATRSQVPPRPTNVTAEDDCDETVSVIFDEKASISANCDTLLTRTWTSTDQCGNAAQRSQVITIRGAGGNCQGQNIQPTIANLTFFPTVNSTDTICLETNELKGTKYTIREICENPEDKATLTPIVGTTCVVCKALSVGTERGCYVICDELGNCDTTYITLNVQAQPTNNQPFLEARDDAFETIIGQAITFAPLKNDTAKGAFRRVEVLTQPRNATVIVEGDFRITYTPVLNYCNSTQPDTFQYKVCTAERCDTAMVRIKVLCDKLQVFTAFSPNGDGVNDVFRINGLEKYPNHKLWVYNRFGNEVYRTENYQSDWIGTWDGSALPDGTYYYFIEDGEGKTYTGYLQIQR